MKQNTFVVSDIHGNYGELWSLLSKAELVDDNEQRTDLGEETFILSIGDYANAVLEDVTGDELVFSRAKDWFDRLIVGNHDFCYLDDSPYVTFSGYYGAPHLISQYRAWRNENFVIPAFIIDNTLITHAGVCDKQYEHADEAHAAIYKAWTEWPPDDPDAFELIGGIGYARGGRALTGGILWSDWNHEKKNKKFSQVVGHTPNPDGPQLFVRKNGTFTINIDTGCKGGGFPTGLWLDDSGQIISWVNKNGTFIPDENLERSA